MKIILFLLLICLISLPNYLPGQSCGSPPKPEAPGGDQPDDNYSFAEFTVGEVSYYFSNPEIFVFESGYHKEVVALVSRFTNKINIFKGTEKFYELLQGKSILIIPSGALYGKENDSTLKYILETYVRRGGTIIVFTQQYGVHIDNVVPIPQGNSIKTYGWREDQSCLANSAYFTANHPVLSSSTNEMVNVGVGGYFSVFPTNSTILLSRKINMEPALLFYSYGENGGHVILTSMFTDVASSRGMASFSGIKKETGEAGGRCLTV